LLVFRSAIAAFVVFSLLSQFSLAQTQAPYRHSVLETLDGRSADLSSYQPSRNLAQRGSAAACFNTTETDSVDFLDDADNTFVDLNIGPNNEFTGIAWDLTLTTNPPSQFNHARLIFRGTGSTAGIILTPGAFDAGTGIMDFNAAGVVLFDDLGFPRPTTGPDGLLSLQFYEQTVDDFPNATDATWNDAGMANSCSGIRLICTDQAACDAAVLARAPTLAVAPVSVDFGNVVVGNGSQIMLATLSNIGSGTLRVNSIAAPDGDFATAAGGTCAAPPFNVSSMGSCTVAYTYNPTVAGPAVQVLTIDSNSQNGSASSLTLEGNGLQGALSLAPANIDFGAVVVGSNSIEQTITLENTGTADLMVAGIDAANAPFVLTGGSCVAPTFTLAVSETCTLAYTYSPLSTGAVSQTINVSSNGSTDPDSFDLLGTGVQPQLSISPSPLDFGDQPVGSISGPQSLTLMNGGTSALTISSVTAATAPFAMTGGSCGATPVTIPAASSCTIVYTFSPTATGPFNQMISILSDSPSSPDAVTLQGNGTQGALMIAPQPLNFGDQLVGTSSAGQSIILSNNGDSPVNVSSITAASAPFSRTGGSCGAGVFSIPVSGNCTIEYTFSPTAIGSASQALSVTSDSGTNPDSINLQGNGVQPALTIAPALADFGDQLVDTGSGAITVTLMNSGTADLSVSSIEAASAAFAVAAGGSCTAPFTLAATESCTVNFTFAPTVTGPASQSLAVFSDAPSNPDSIELQGNGVQGSLVVTPVVVDFGNQLIGTTSSPRNVTLSNNGTAAIDVSSVTAAAAPFAVSGGSCGAAPFSIAVSGNCTLTYTFMPSVPVSQNQVITINSNASTTPDGLTLQGAGVEAQLTISPSPLDFGEQVVGVASSAQSVTLSNPGSGPLTVSSVSLSAPFAITGGSCGAAPYDIPAAGHCSLTVTLTPANTGPVSDNLVVNSNAATSPDSIVVQGNGVQPQLSVTPSPLNFGDQPVGTASGAQSLTLMNGGNSTLTITSVSASAAPFATTGGSCGATPITIPASSSCTISYTFSPSATGAASQVIGLESDAPSSPDAVTLQGNGTQGALEIAQQPLNFGDHLVGTTSDPQSVTLSNSGDAAVNVSSITAASAPFSRTGGSCAAGSFSIPVSGNCTIEYTFSPTATGAANQSLTVTSDSGTNPDTIMLQGNGVQPALTITPTPVDFGDQLVGSTSGVMTATIINSGSADLSVTSIEAATAPFAVVAGGSCSAAFTLAATESCTVNFTFAPTAAASAMQSLAVVSDADSSPDSIDLQGNGVQPELTITPTPLNFGDQAVDTSSSVMTVTLLNSGSADLTVTTIEAATAPFAVVAGGTCSAPFTLSTMESCTINHVFSPTLTGMAMQSLEVVSDASSSPDSIELQGNGVQGMLEISPAPLNFGDQEVDTSSAPLSLSLSNTGDAAVTIASISSAATPFALTGGDCGAEPITIGASSTCTLEYTFTPTVIGMVSQILTFASDAPSSPDTVDLQGTGVEGVLEVSPSSINFGAVVISQSSMSEAVTLSNTGTSPVMIDSISVATAAFARTGGTCDTAPFSLSPSSSCTLEYTFAPRSVDDFNQTITVSSVSGAGTTVLQGSGVQPSLIVDPEILRFEITQIGQMDGPLTVNVTNVGNAAVTLGNLATQGPAAGEFVIDMDGCSGMELLSDDVCTFDVTYVPTRTGVVLSAVVSAQGNGVVFDLTDLIAAGVTEGFIFIDGFE